MTQRIALFLRNTAGINHFRQLLDGLLKIPTLTGAVITSGFYQEDHKFSASSIFKFPCVKRAAPLSLTFVGVYNGRWVPDFRIFANRVYFSNCSCCVSLSIRSPKSLRWHAKIFIGSIQGQPRVGIIGSSNLTRPAADTSKPFNYEADALLWYQSDSEVNSVVQEILGPLAQSGQVLVTTYNQEDRINGGRSLEVQLQSLQEEILHNSLEA